MRVQANQLRDGDTVVLGAETAHLVSVWGTAEGTVRARSDFGWELEWRAGELVSLGELTRN